jgi:hypothetical protein
MLDFSEFKTTGKQAPSTAQKCESKNVLYAAAYIM